MKSLCFKSTSVLALALIAGGVLVTTAATSVSAAEQKDSTGQVEFAKGDIHFGEDGVTGEGVPSFDFGQQKITTENQTYTAKEDGVLKVTDLRGTGAGWKVTVTQQAQLTTDDNDELTGAQLSLLNATVKNTNNEVPTAATDVTLTPEVASTVLTADVDKGNGLSTLTWSKDNSKLSVPGQTTKKAKQYTATLEWTLADTPN